MGKKGKDPDQETGAVQSLFSADNPLRSKPHREAPVAQPAPAQELGFAQLSLGSEDGPGGAARARKRKIDETNLTPASVPEKRAKLGDGSKAECSRKKRKKRKRAEIEEQYAKRKYGNAEDASEGERTAGVGKKRKAAYLNSSQLVESKEPFDDENVLVRTVFVGNLPSKETTQKALLKEFAKYGEIDSIRIRSVPIIDRSNAPTKAAILEGKVDGVIHSVHAYIVFKDEQSAKAALSHNMTLFRGNHVRVDMACPPHKKLKGEAPLYERKRTVFVGNLPFDAKDEELYHLFYSSGESASNVEAVRVVRDPYTSLGKGIAYVLFRSRDAADSVVSKKDWKMRDHILTLCLAKSLGATSASVAPSKRKGHEEERGGGEPDAMTPKAKRPAVAAARKGKQLSKKRNQESRTPEANHMKKKARKHHV